MAVYAIFRSEAFEPLMEAMLLEQRRNKVWRSLMKNNNYFESTDDADDTHEFYTPPEVIRNRICCDIQKILHTSIEGPLELERSRLLSDKVRPFFMALLDDIVKYCNIVYEITLLNYDGSILLKGDNHARHHHRRSKGERQSTFCDIRYRQRQCRDIWNCNS